MKITGTSYIDFSGFIITNNNQGLYIDDDAGTGTPPNHITVTDVTVHDVGQEGIAIRGDTTNILLNRVTVYNTGRNGTSSNGEGIYIGGGNAPDNTNAVTVQNSVIHDTQDEGIELKAGTHDCIVEGNTLYNNLAPGSSYSSGGGAIEIDNPSGNYGSNPNHVIRGNIIRDIGFTSGITKYGIRAGTGAKVYNNVLYNINNNYNAVQCNDANDYPRIIYHNTVDAASNRAVVNSGTTMDSKNNIGPATPNNLAILPLMFVNYTSHDYHLVATLVADLTCGALFRRTLTVVQGTRRLILEHLSMCLRNSNSISYPLPRQPRQQYQPSPTPTATSTHTPAATATSTPTPTPDRYTNTNSNSYAYGYAYRGYFVSGHFRHYYEPVCDKWGFNDLPTRRNTRPSAGWSGALHLQRHDSGRLRYVSHGELPRRREQLLLHKYRRGAQYRDGLAHPGHVGIGEQDGDLVTRYRAENVDLKRRRPSVDHPRSRS